MWWRGTLVAADNLSYIVKTNYIYVELLNRNGGVVMRRKVLRDGLCFHHNLPLPEDLTSGEYTLRAYSSWMRNFTPELFFSRRLTIVNTQTENALHPHGVEKDFGVQFFPEGGALLQGVRQRVAYKAEGNDGRPVEIDGVLKNAAGETLATLHSRHDGMGTFTTPELQAGDSLLIEATIRDYSDANGMPFGRTFVLKGVQSSGYALQTRWDDAGQLHYRVLHTADRLPSDSLRLLLHAGSTLTMIETIGGDAEGVIAPQLMRQGVNHLVLASLSGEGLSRRLLFRYNERNHVTGDILVSGNIDHRRELIHLDIALHDEEGRPMRGDFAISVLDEGLVRVGHDSLHDHLLSNLLLTSDLKGYVHQAAWYFAEDSVRREELDLVMMTHGWCRFDTDRLAQHPSREFPEPLEEREWISGRVGMLKKEDMKGGKVMISVVDTVNGTMGTTTLDHQGNFFVGNLNFPDNAALQVRVLSTGDYPKFYFDKYIFPEPTHKEPFSLNFTTQGKDSTDQLFYFGTDGIRTHQLDNVSVTARRRERLPFIIPDYMKKRDFAYLDTHYDLYEYDRGIDLLREMMENEWYYYSSQFTLGRYLINGVEYDTISGEGMMERLYSEDIASIALLETEHSHDARTYAISVETKPGTEVSDRIRDQRRKTTHAFGYTPAQHFYMPLYRTREEIEFPELDYRKTIAWEPSFQTDKEGRVRLSFYNSDHVGKPRWILIEGVTFNGRPVHIQHEIR